MNKTNKTIGKGMISCLLAAALASCMGEGGNPVRYSSRMAVVQEKPWKSLYVTEEAVPEGYLVSSADFETRDDLKDGDCCLVEYKIDFSDQYKDGVYEARILRCDPIDVWPVKSQLTDTASILPYEQFTALSFPKSQYMKGRYFLEIQMKEHQDTRPDFVELSYDPEETPVAGTDGRRAYHLFLRAWREEAPDTIKPYSRVVPSAFVLENFVGEKAGAEKEAGADALHFVICYPERFNTDTTGLIWAVTDTFSVRLD